MKMNEKSNRFRHIDAHYQISVFPPQKPRPYRYNSCRIYCEIVGMPGFEPGTSCAQGRRASRAALHPDFFNFSIYKSSSPLAILGFSLEYEHFTFRSTITCRWLRAGVPEGILKIWYLACLLVMKDSPGIHGYRKN